MFPDIQIGKHPYQGQRNPESTIGDKRTVTEIIAALKFLKTCNKLGTSAQSHCRTPYDSRTTPTQVMKLEKQCGGPETRQTDYRWIYLVLELT